MYCFVAVGRKRAAAGKNADVGVDCMDWDVALESWVGLSQA